MKKLFILALPIYLVSCGGSSEEETTNENETPETVEACTYSYDPEATVLTWTGFKLTEKVGVSGTFDEINVTANDGAENMFDVLNGATFSIPIQSINSQEPTRDPKLRKNFFGVMTETENITGIITNINESMGSIELMINQVEVEYDGKVSVDGEKITWSSTIDMNHFDAGYAIDSLNNVCKERHTGEDGISKLWTEVDIAVSTTLVKTCK